MVVKDNLSSVLIWSLNDPSEMAIHNPVCNAAAIALPLSGVLIDWKAQLAIDSR